MHAAAFVDEAAALDPTATVLRGAVVHAGARIGAHTVIGEGAVVYGRTRIDERVTVGPLAVIGRPGFGWAAGPDGAIIRVPQLGGVIIEADVEVGALATIDAGTLSPTILRRGVKLDAHVHVGAQRRDRRAHDRRGSGGFRGFGAHRRGRLGRAAKPASRITRPSAQARASPRRAA